MKLKKNKRPILKNPVAWLVAIAILGLAFVVLEKTHVIDFFKAPASDSQGPTVEQQKQEIDANAAKKKEAIENDPKTDSSSPSAPGPGPSIDLSARQEDNNTVTVFTKLYGYSDGSCELVVTNAGKTSTQTADAMYQPEFSSCAGFSVPVGPLGKGIWSIKLSVISSSATYDKTISLEVK